MKLLDHCTITDRGDQHPHDDLPPRTGLGGEGV
jgi:hypothetical protein